MNFLSMVFGVWPQRLPQRFLGCGPKLALNCFNEIFYMWPPRRHLKLQREVLALPSGRLPRTCGIHGNVRRLRNRGIQVLSPFRIRGPRDLKYRLSPLLRRCARRDCRECTYADCVRWKQDAVQRNRDVSRPRNACRRHCRARHSGSACNLHNHGSRIQDSVRPLRVPHPR